MSKKLVLLLPLFAGLPLLLTGAIRRPAPELAPISVFHAEAITLAPDVASPGMGATEFLDRAVDRVSPPRLGWLHVGLWQRMRSADLAFESQGTLQIGPNHCVRLDLAVRAGAGTGRRLVVSDGNAVACIVQRGNSIPEVTTRSLTEKPTDTPQPPPADALRDLGCGGPYPLLNDLRQNMREMSLETGKLQGRPVLRIGGRLTIRDGSSVPADFCYLYLQAQTLWPSRLEWWERGRGQGRPLLEIEFRDPVVNRPLTLPECIRAFSYSPDQG
jgi:hypothetical protein